MASSRNAGNSDTTSSLPEGGYTLRQALVAPKDKFSRDEKQEVIYSVRCQGCDGEYVGETAIKLSTGMKEHIVSVTKGNDKSVLSTTALGLATPFTGTTSS